MEPAQSSVETAYYSNVEETRTAKPAGYPLYSYTDPNNYVSKLNGNGNKVGPGIVLKVMSGDKVNIRASSWYYLNGADPGTPVNPLNDLLNVLATGVTTVVTDLGKFTRTELISNGILNPGVGSMLDQQTASYSNTTKPKAYLSWLLLDEQFKLVGSSSGFEQVGADGEFKTWVKSNLPINRNGYLYVYTSNESPVDVFFDNLQVSHIRGPLLEETHYYPFGLTMAGVSSKAAGKLENRFKYNGGSELQNKEFSDGSGLEMYDTHFRNLDPQLGRWWQIDPKPDYSQSLYAAMGNNPILYNDILGDTLPRPNPTTNVFAPTNWFGNAAITGSNARTKYNVEVAKIDPQSPTAKQERTQLKEQARSNTPEPFNSAVEAGRPMEGERAKINDPLVNNPTKTNVEVNETAKTTGALGKIFIVGGLFNSGINIATSNNPAGQVVVEGGAWLGAIQGGTAGAQIGAIGGVPGAFVGGIAGSIGGGIVGSKAGQWLIKNGTLGDDRHNGFIINGAFIPNKVLDKR